MLILGAHSAGTNKTRKLLKNILKSLNLCDQDIILLDTCKEEKIQQKILELKPLAILVAGFTGEHDLIALAKWVNEIGLNMEKRVISMDLLHLLHSPIDKAKSYQHLLRIQHNICLNQVA